MESVNLHIRPGERVAIVGRNGAGKTTLVRLIIDLYEPYHGRIRYGGQVVTEENAAEVRRRIAAGFHDFLRMQLPVRENVAFSDIARLHDDARIQQALAEVELGSFLAANNHDLDMYLGRDFGGVELSGGQWQRIA